MSDASEKMVKQLVLRQCLVPSETQRQTGGRALMRRMKRQRAKHEGQAPRTLHEMDYLLLVDDEARAAGC